MAAGDPMMWGSKTKTDDKWFFTSIPSTVTSTESVVLIGNSATAVSGNNSWWALEESIGSWSILPKQEGKQLDLFPNL